MIYVHRLIARAAAAVLAVALPGVVVAADAAAGMQKAQVCIACHGPEGVSATPAIPSLAGQPAQFIATQLLMFREGKRKDPQMSPFAANLTNTDLNNIAAYFTAQKLTLPAVTADAAAAESLKSKKQAEATRNQVSEETLKLQRAVEQLAAAREVAALEYQLAQSGVEAAQTRLDAGTGGLHDLVDARGQASERYLISQDADFEYQRARLNLLRATGELEKWALPNATK